MESSPLRVIPLLSISSPCRGILFYRYRERARGRLVLETEVSKKAGLWLWVMMYYMYCNCFNFNICCIRVKFELLNYGWIVEYIYIVMSIGL